MIPRVLLVLLALACAPPAAGAPPRMVLQHSPVMGFRHYEGKAVWPELSVGDPVLLVREPDNPEDARAIRVEWRGHKLGYVARADNADLARLIDNGSTVQARIAALEKGRRPNNRVRIEIYLPTEGAR